jgi:hypothetical protein
MKRVILGGVLAASVAWPWATIAGLFADFETELRDAYGQYRTALFQSNSGNADATSQAMKALSEKWATLSTTWGKDAPPQYADDPDFGTTLSAVADVIDQASKEVAAGDLPKAHLTLEGIRAEVGALHERNGIISFSDRMNAYHAKMEAVLELDLANLPDGGTAVLCDGAAILAYLAQDIVDHPAPEGADAAYAPLVDGLIKSVSALQSAVRSGDAAAVAAAVGGLKAPYSKLFAKFG